MRSFVNYYDVEDEVMLEGIDPASAVVMLAQVPEAQVFVPSLELPPEEGTGKRAPPEPEPPGTGMPGGWPAAVAVVPASWDLDSEPATYRVNPGDTLSGLSATYLGRPERWREIWETQTPSFRGKRTPDKIFVGDVLLMPTEAADNMRAFLALRQPSGQKPGELTPEQKKRAAGKSVVPWLVGGGIAAVVGMYLLS